MWRLVTQSLPSTVSVSPPGVVTRTIGGAPVPARRRFFTVSPLTTLKVRLFAAATRAGPNTTPNSLGLHPSTGHSLNRRCAQSMPAPGWMVPPKAERVKQATMPELVT